MRPRRVPLKDHFFESRLFFGRVMWLAILVVLLTGVTIARLMYLQINHHEHFSTLSDDNRVKVVAIPPARGLIFDRRGVLLADNRPAYRLEIVPEQIGGRDKLDGLLRQLSEIIELDEDDIERFKAHKARRRAFEGIPLRFHLTEEEVARLAVLRHRLPGINITARLNRHYPYGGSMAHVVGYVGRIDERDLQRLEGDDYLGTSHTGKTGIERFYEEQLHGRVGFEQVETNAQGRVLRSLEQEPPVPGRNLYLSLDSRLQLSAEEALGEFTGAVVVMDPRNGEVLALVSKPGYDPNAFVNGISRNAYRALREDRDQPLFNRASLGQYPPGSTIKPFMGLAGLHYDVTDEYREQWCPGFYTLPGDDRRFRDWKRSGHGHVNLDEAIAQSCDVYFYDLAKTLGIDRIHDFLAHFGFGEKTGIDLPAERRGLLPSREWKRVRRGQVWFPGETLNTGIGQGFTLSTPLQLAVATATLATRGQRLQPRLVRATEEPRNEDLAVLSSFNLPPVSGVAPDHWDEIIDSMIHVVHGKRGTAGRIKTDEFEIAGKTGTAQVFGIKQDQEYDEDEIAEKLRDHALFVAFAPAAAPRVVVAVVVENGGSGGSVAAPIARRILDSFFAIDNT